jgi:hypothetical protein
VILPRRRLELLESGRDQGQHAAGQRPILRAGSVFGRAFRCAGVAELLGCEARRGEVRECLEALAEREIVVRPRPGREEEYVFRHALLREAAYALLTDEDRARGHRLAAEWLERTGEPDAASLAEYCERVGQPARAAGLRRRAATPEPTRDDEQAAPGASPHTASA